jgi:hypothetical protein
VLIPIEGKVSRTRVKMVSGWDRGTDARFAVKTDEEVSGRYDKRNPQTTLPSEKELLRVTQS